MIFYSAGSFTVSVSIDKDGVFGSANAQGTVQTEGQVIDVPLVVLITQPLFGLALAAIVLGERPAPVTLVAGVAILGGAWLVQGASKPEALIA